MKTLYVYPGTFSPPTFGHLNVARQAAAIFPEVLILCSENPNKNQTWFTPAECQRLWSSYSLPQNVTISTLAEFQPQLNQKTDIVMIRGLRSAADYEEEKRVMLYNHEKFGIDKCLYIFGHKRHQNISSSRVRQEVEQLKLDQLSQQVSPLVISALLEKVLKIKNIFLVVGQPGSGKSTLLKKLTEIDSRNYHINTDDFNHQLKDLLKKDLSESDLIKMAIEEEAKIKRIIARPWFELLTQSLKSAPAGSNVFVEVPYGLQTDKAMWRFVGGKIIYVGCEDEAINLNRINARGTPQLAAFIKKIPNRLETKKIVKKHRLNASYINTNCSWLELAQKAEKINHLIMGGNENAYDL